MRIKSTELVRRALMLLDESVEELEAAVSYGDMGMELRRLATELVPEAMRKVMLEAPWDRIDESLALEGDYRTEAGIGELTLPEDYLRLVELRMAGWDVGLHDYTGPVAAGERGWTGRVLRHHPDAVRTAEQRGQTAGVWPGRTASGRVLRISGISDDRPPLVAQYLPAPKDGCAMLWIPSALVYEAAHELARMVRSVITE